MPGICGPGRCCVGTLMLHALWLRAQFWHEAACMERIVHCLMQWTGKAAWLSYYYESSQVRTGEGLSFSVGAGNKSYFWTERRFCICLLFLYFRYLAVDFLLFYMLLPLWEAVFNFVFLIITTVFLGLLKKLYCMILCYVSVFVVNHFYGLFDKGHLLNKYTY